MRQSLGGCLNRLWIYLYSKDDYRNWECLPFLGITDGCELLVERYLG
ncbi:hypothetical protein CEXT_755181, partial [Caerostris extrusa]